MSIATDAPTAVETVDSERAEILATLAQHRFFLRHTVTGLTDEQAATRSTTSELTLAGLVKHVADVERQWVDFIEQGTSVFDAVAEQWRNPNPDLAQEDFTVLPGETLASLTAEYDRVAERTERVVLALPDLDRAHPLPEAPWFPAGSSWSARRVLLHILAETSQHAGHADIIRESIDGQKTMG
ncbi:DinB family protein [Actinoalloteichus hymeniacidonis]|uniref:DUF664 family protein n=1 Tax=Actinoalloteichus hymeniacidonis TaxID=340345 RepID=A0AAC9HN33_9PSEU|nr:DinB family protein [Actinoalloteichus hymeniacidonis]AOS62231.1 putative DUF664 family protein [Actinoalloteichus hymeniacidonis]MBB5909743.1 putative damage-inducible protein DinB [Actinoalloteichus hymeniacidonis]